MDKGTGMKSTEALSDELFCLKYEVDIMAGYISQNKLERWVPGFTDVQTDFDHRQRYEWVSKFIENKVVLDIASGSGMGSFLMSGKGKAKSVLGCDIEEDAVRYASIKFKNPNLKYERQDATSYIGPEKYDVIVSFETVEHIPATDLYLETINKNLQDNGVFIVSTPIAAMDEDLKPRNTYHVKEWGFRKFQEVISSKFVIQKIFVQLHAAVPFGFVDRIMNKINPDSFSKRPTVLEEFTNQFPVNKFGKSITGYQILVCKKN